MCVCVCVWYVVIILRLRVVSLGQHSEVTFREDTGLLKLTLAQDEVSRTQILSNMFFIWVIVCVFVRLSLLILMLEYVVDKHMTCALLPPTPPPPPLSLQEYSLPRLGNNFTFPLYISVNMTLTSNDDYTLDTSSNNNNNSP